MYVFQYGRVHNSWSFMPGLDRTLAICLPMVWRSIAEAYRRSYFVAALAYNETEIVAFHGTSDGKANRITRTGFNVSEGGMLGRGVYVTRDIRKAYVYASLDGRRQDGVILVVRVRLGSIARIDSQGHRMQHTWQREFDSAFVPARCGMVLSDREEACVADPSRIDVIGRLIMAPCNYGGGCLWRAIRCWRMSLEGYTMLALRGVRDGILDLLCVPCLAFLVATLYKLPRLIRIAAAGSITRRTCFDLPGEVLRDVRTCCQNTYWKLIHRGPGGPSITEDSRTDAFLDA